MTRTKLWVALQVALPVAAVAQPVRGPYVSLGGGVNLLQNEIEKPFDGFGPLKRAYSFNAGPAVAASVGYGFGNGLRMEIEGNFTTNDVKGVKLNIPEFAGGSERQYGGFFNAFYDFNPHFSLTPYIGVGAGGQAISLDGIYTSSSAAPIASGDETKGSFAYQGIVGASYRLGSASALSLTAEYRMVGVLTPPAYDRSNGSRSLLNGEPMRATFNNIFNHVLMVGLRYELGARPAAPPVASPAPPPLPIVDRSFLIFFDWDKADLSERARQIIAEAARFAQSGGISRITVDGYTDLSGSAAYNQRLSLRRANVVAAELVRDGIPKNDITTHGLGELHPLVPTAAGVREPQNRRVQLIFNK